MQWRRRLPLLILTAAASLFLLWAFLPRAVPVDTATAVRGPLRVTIEEEGKTRLKDRFVVSAPVTGYADRVELEVGDAVRKGQAVATVEPLRTDGLDARARAAGEARVAAAEAGLRQANANVREAEATERYATDLLERTTQLAGAGLATRDAAERVESEASRAREARAAAAAAADAARHDVAQAQAALMRGGKGTDPRDAVAVRSPVAGRVLAVSHESEGVVQAGAPLVTVGDPGRLEVAVDVLSSDAVRIHAGTAVRFERWGGEKELEGTVRRVEPAGFTKVSALGVEEQRVFVIADLTSPRSEWETVGDGYRLEARFIVWEGDGILQLPAGAVFRLGDRSAVYAVEGGRARLRTVEVGKRSAAAVQILSGIAEGERAIVHPGDTVSDGTRVRAR
jgi:HlyD family secretion protein